MLVVIDEPKGPAWGGTVAAPVFREVGEQVLRHLKIPPQRGGDVQVAAVGIMGRQLVGAAKTSE